MNEAFTPVRIAYVAHSLNPGGTERLVADMALALSDEVEIRVICLDEPGVWADGLRQRGVPVHCVWRQPGLDPGVAVRLAELLRRHRVDLVHAHQYTPWFYAALARLIHRRPRLLFEEHGRFHPEVVNRPRMFVNRWLLRRLTGVIVAVSGDIRDRLIAYEGIPPGVIRVVHNGANPVPPVTESERASLRRELGCRDGEILIGTVGRLDPIKNLPLLLRGFSQLRGHRSDIRLVLIGDGPERQRVEQLTRDLGLGECVELTGFRTDATRLLPALDLFVMTSFSEGTSMALLEAMSVGLPVAVSRVGGNPEVVQAGHTGLLFASDDQRDFTQALDQLLADPALRQRLGQAARRDFAERFSFPVMLGHYRTLYRELARGLQ